MRDRKGKDIEFVQLNADIPRGVKAKMEEHLRRRDESQRKFVERALERQIKEDQAKRSEDEE